MPGYLLGDGKGLGNHTSFPGTGVAGGPVACATSSWVGSEVRGLQVSLPAAPAPSPATFDTAESKSLSE